MFFRTLHSVDEIQPSMRVSAQLRDAIDWRKVNLLDSARVEALGKFDAILCRNVLIYFRDPTTTRVIDQLASALKVGGLLLVGASESLARFGTSLKCEERSGRCKVALGGGELRSDVRSNPDELDLRRPREATLVCLAKTRPVRVNKCLAVSCISFTDD